VKGYFGPWRQCKYLLYGREWCGQSVSRFQPVCEFRYVIIKNADIFNVSSPKRHLFFTKFSA